VKDNIVWPSSAPTVGQRAERTWEVLPRDIELFTAISGDRNPLHYNEELTKATKFGGIVTWLDKELTMDQSNIWTLLNSVLQKILLLVLLCGSVDLYGQTFTKVATGDIVNDNSRSTGGSWADYDHDGYLDFICI